jgi:crotonobetainyl-CoA:carnitine CoA-transferase CaiB-like acyl-CoA transferase
MSATPGSIRWTGRERGADNDAVYAGLGLTSDELADLRQQGVI